MPDIRDRITNVKGTTATESAFQALDALQDIQPSHLQPLAAAIVFLLCCRAFRLNPSDTLLVADNIIHDVESQPGGDNTMRAIRQYFKEEIRD